MVTEALKRHGINKDYSYGALKTTHPVAYEELRQAGYYGSVIDEHDPLQNGFDYYYGYNTDHFTDKAMEFMDGKIRKKQPFYDLPKCRMGIFFACFA